MEQCFLKPCKPLNEEKTAENWKMNMLFGIVIALYTHDYTIVFVASAAAREKAKSTA